MLYVSVWGRTHHLSQPSSGVSFQVRRRMSIGNGFQWGFWTCCSFHQLDYLHGTESAEVIWESSFCKQTRGVRQEHPSIHGPCALMGGEGSSSCWSHQWVKVTGMRHFLFILVCVAYSLTRKFRNRQNYQHTVTTGVRHKSLVWCRRGCRICGLHKQMALDRNC